MTWIKVGILYMKRKLFNAVNDDTMLNLGCDYAVCFLNKHEARIVKKHGRSKKLAPLKVWFAGRVYKMHRKINNCWVEYMNPIDLMDHPSNMEIGFMLVLKKNQK